jgi:catechol 2,3-dioxygenase-like lactoylglutathione lyase family enzyme
MRARSFSHVGITVSDFNKAVQFYWDVFGCPLVGVADTPPDRVRTFFGVDGQAPGCKIGWIRAPGGGVLEIFAFTPQRPPVPVVWNQVGLTHISFNVRKLQRWYDYLVSKGVECVSGLREAAGCLLILAAGALEGWSELRPGRRQVGSLPPYAPATVSDLSRRDD